ncbi:MAG: FKBP-type peptidyl-prolyl cis-trans isomerase [Daejeonella sp.]
MKLFNYIFAALLLSAVVMSCKKEYETIETLDARNIQEYIKANGLTMQQYENTGIYYQVIIPGTGAEMNYSDQIPSIYSIRSLDGKYVDTDSLKLGNRVYSYLGYYNPEGIRLVLKEVLKNRGGSVRVIIPSRLAFGKKGSGNIPGNASLDFIVKTLDETKLPEYDDLSINKYLQANSLTGFTKSASGLYYKIADAGTGSPITVDSVITAEYTGKLLNGSVFDQTSTGAGATFRLSDLVEGWKESVPLIKQGGTIRIIVPSKLGYGLPGSTAVPPFSSLDFNIKVTNVSQ